MVLVWVGRRRALSNSPRIRGDGPALIVRWECSGQFSPYSRGWSRVGTLEANPAPILPVFAGMVRLGDMHAKKGEYSPRIRGDGPSTPNTRRSSPQFSPYSRGWSHRSPAYPGRRNILPVFAGMVPGIQGHHTQHPHSPRIRGDGPAADTIMAFEQSFSPYSRGWSRC